MRERVSARSLLARAAELYDDPRTHLELAAKRAAGGGFKAGARWMRLAMQRERRFRIPNDVARSLTKLGVAKYLIALAMAALCATLAFVPHVYWLAPLVGATAFYLVEAQMLFLFPVALDGSMRPFRDSFVLTRLAGGTLRVLPALLMLAGSMLFGGLVGRGFLRSWCLGCLAVCNWYESIRASAHAETSNDLQLRPTHRPA